MRKTVFKIALAAGLGSLMAVGASAQNWGPAPGQGGYYGPPAGYYGPPPGYYNNGWGGNNWSPWGGNNNWGPWGNNNGWGGNNWTPWGGNNGWNNGWGNNWGPFSSNNNGRGNGNGSFNFGFSGDVKGEGQGEGQGRGEGQGYGYGNGNGYGYNGNGWNPAWGPYPGPQGPYGAPAPAGQQPAAPAEGGETTEMQTPTADAAEGASN